MDPVAYLEKNWAIVSGAPLAFIVWGIIVSVIAWRISKNQYEGIIAALRDRITAKDEQITSLKERLGEIAPSGGYATLGHEDLKKQAMRLVEDIRDMYAQYKEKDSSLFPEFLEQKRSAASEEGVNKLWRQMTETSIRLSFELSHEYETRAKVKAVLLRDEMLSRLRPMSRNKSTDTDYEDPVNTFSYRSVADDLERLATLLK